MAHEIQAVIGAIIGGIILVVLVLQESPGVLAVARLLLPAELWADFSFLCAGSDCLKIIQGLPKNNSGDRSLAKRDAHLTFCPSMCALT